MKRVSMKRVLAALVALMFLLPAFAQGAPRSRGAAAKAGAHSTAGARHHSAHSTAAARHHSAHRHAAGHGRRHVRTPRWPPARSQIPALLAPQTQPQITVAHPEVVVPNIAPEPVYHPMAAPIPAPPPHVPGTPPAALAGPRP